jgi:hypothetical protein
MTLRHRAFWILVWILVWCVVVPLLAICEWLDGKE